MTKNVNESRREEAMQLITVHKGALDILAANKYTQGYTEGFRKGFKLAVGIWATSLVIGYTIGMVKFVKKKV